MRHVKVQIHVQVLCASTQILHFDWDHWAIGARRVRARLRARAQRQVNAPHAPLRALVAQYKHDQQYNRKMAARALM